MADVKSDKGKMTLSRRLTEKILIGDDIEITVSGIMGSRVQLTVSAPREVAISRGEAGRCGKGGCNAKP